MKKIKNPNLTKEQKIVLFEEGTENPGSSELNQEKREGTYHCEKEKELNCDIKTFLILILNMKVDRVGLHFLNRSPMFLKQKLITI